MSDKMHCVKRHCITPFYISRFLIRKCPLTDQVPKHIRAAFAHILPDVVGGGEVRLSAQRNVAVFFRLN